MIKHIEEPELDPRQVAEAASNLLRARKTIPNDPIEKLFHTPIPNELWHYTSLKGLEGILASDRVWATEAHFTTDSTEFVHARDVAQTFLSSLSPTTEEDKRAKHLAMSIIEEEFETGALSKSASEVFVASFSSAANLKSQWNEYADNGQGVSIAFDLRKVRPPEDLEVAVTVAPCVYDAQEKEKLIQSALRQLTETASEMHRQTGDHIWVARRMRDWHLVDKIFGMQFDKQEFQGHMERELTLRLRSALAVTKFDLLRLASHCKNPYFSEEKEWRVALPHTKGTPLTHVEIQYRGPKGNIPYVAHNLFYAGKLPITRILVGPRCVAEEEVKTLLHRYSYDVPIEKALSPSRSIDDF